MQIQKTRNKKYERGRFGEEVCAHMLLCRGYKILKRNYKVIGGEVDIICSKECTLVFVEVKTWEFYTEFDLMYSVNEQKLLRLQTCAHSYIAGNECSYTRTCVRFDVMFLVLSHHKVVHYKGVL